MPRRATAWGGRPVIGRSSKMMRPALGGSWPVIRLNSVVFPAPLGPMMARRSSAATLSETSFTAARAPKWRLSRSMASSAGGRIMRGARSGRAGADDPAGREEHEEDEGEPRISIHRSVYELTRLWSRMKAAARARRRRACRCRR